MRPAPAVRVRCSGGRSWHWLQAVLTGCAAGAVLAWGLGHSGWSPASEPAGLLAALLVTVGLGLRTAPVERSLQWDGSRWSVQGSVGSLAVMMDLDSWLLLRLRPDDRAAPDIWLAVTRHDAGPAWHGLRAAAYSRAPAAARHVRAPAATE